MKEKTRVCTIDGKTARSARAAAAHILKNHAALIMGLKTSEMGLAVDSIFPPGSGERS